MSIHHGDCSIKYGFTYCDCRMEDDVSRICGGCGQVLTGDAAEDWVHPTTPAADYEAADMVHRNRLGLAREAAAASTVDVLAAEVRVLSAENARLRRELNIATGGDQ